MSTAVKQAAALRDDPARRSRLGADRRRPGLGRQARPGCRPRAAQGRSRLIAGTSGSGKTTDLEREALIAARQGRKFFLIDGKGTDPGLVERALAGYLAGNPFAKVALWPELPMDGWRGSGRPAPPTG